MLLRSAVKEVPVKRLIVINLSDFAKSTDARSEFRKLQEAIRLPIIKEIYKLPPHLEPFGQENYVYNFSSG